MRFLSILSQEAAADRQVTQAEMIQLAGEE